MLRIILLSKSSEIWRNSFLWNRAVWLSFTIQRIAHSSNCLILRKNWLILVWVFKWLSHRFKIMLSAKLHCVRMLKINCLVISLVSIFWLVNHFFLSKIILQLLYILISLSFLFEHFMLLFQLLLKTFNVFFFSNLLLQFLYLVFFFLFFCCNHLLPHKFLFSYLNVLFKFIYVFLGFLVA